MKKKKPNMERIRDIQMKLAEMNDTRDALILESYRYFNREKVGCHLQADDDTCKHWSKELNPNFIGTYPIPPGCSFSICPYIPNADIGYEVTE